MYPTLIHPDRYIWDFWYYFDGSQFHVFFLNAEAGVNESNNHHLVSQVGYATTRDFMQMNWLSFDVLKADPNQWYNTSIWTGDVIRFAGGFLMFFTSRCDSDVDNKMTQNIGVAFAERVDGEWQVLSEIRIKPLARYYETGPVDNDLTTHAWRDPFLFIGSDDVIYMILSAKDRTLSLGKKGAVALLRLDSKDIESWTAEPALVAPGYYSEMEVPQLYRDTTGKPILVFSCWRRGDFAPTTAKLGGLQTFTADRFGQFCGRQPAVLMPEASHLYAARIIPEFSGEIVGFDTKSGGIRRSGVKTQWRHVDRDFSKRTFANL